MHSPVISVMGALFKPATICSEVVERPFDRLTALSRVEGHQSVMLLWPELTRSWPVDGLFTSPSIQRGIQWADMIRRIENVQKR